MSSSILSMEAATSTQVLTLEQSLGSTRSCAAAFILNLLNRLYCVQRPGSKGTIEDVLRPGSEMVAAGYTMYDPCSLTSRFKISLLPVGTDRLPISFSRLVLE